MTFEGSQRAIPHPRCLQGFQPRPGSAALSGGSVPLFLPSPHPEGLQNEKNPARFCGLTAVLLGNEHLKTLALQIPKLNASFGHFLPAAAP